MARPAVTLEKALRASLPTRARLLLAVSGGKDSVALLHSCVQYARRFPLMLGVVHYDHALRRGSQADERFVRALAEEAEIPYFSERAKNPPKTNIEAWARERRYSFFDQVRDAHRYEWVLTAHTANDVAETLLMKLLTNKELGSIAPRCSERGLLRPFLGVSRSTIEVYCLKMGLRFREDPSNCDTRFLRNRVRKALAVLESSFDDRRVTEIFAKRAQTLGADLAFLHEEARSSALQVMAHQFGTRSWLVAVRGALGRTHSAIGWRVVENLLFSKLGFNIGEEHALRVVSFLNGNGVKLDLPSGKQLQRKGGVIKIL